MVDATNLEKRVENVEHAVDILHKDSIRTQSAIASIASHIDSIVETMHTIDTKLDAHRTRRPELGALAAIASVILTIMGFSAVLINDNIDDAVSDLSHDLAEIKAKDDKLEKIVDERTYIIGRYSAIIEHQQEAFERLEQRVDKLHEN